MRSTAPPRNAFSPVYVPIVNLSKSDLRLRPEFASVCSHSNIPLSYLITLNDLPDQFRQPENIHWILVDHNKLQGQLGLRNGSQVYGVIDHHDEENFVPQDTAPEPRVIEKCGSCTSLVVRYCKSTWDAISSTSLSSGAAHAQGEFAINDSAVTQGWDAQMAKMAIASILIDTANLTAPGKVEQVDREAVEYLEAKIQMSIRDARSWNRKAYYEEIDAAKSDIGGLSLDEILQKDYKLWAENGLRLGMSTVVKPLRFLVDKAESGPALKEGIEQFMEQRDLSIFAIMTLITFEGEFQRELFLQARKAAAVPISNFLDRAVSELDLQDLEIEGLNTQNSLESESLGPRIWRQKALSKSRKQVAPMLREAMKT